MHTVLATGGTSIDPRSGRIELAPLVTVLVALVLMRVVFGIRLRWPVVAAVAAAGTTLGFAIETWGVLVPTAVALAATTILTAPLHRRARRRGESSA